MLISSPAPKAAEPYLIAGIIDEGLGMMAEHRSVLKIEHR